MLVSIVNFKTTFTIVTSEILIYCVLASSPLLPINLLYIYVYIYFLHVHMDPM